MIYKDRTPLEIKNSLNDIMKIEDGPFHIR